MPRSGLGPRVRQARQLREDTKAEVLRRFEDADLPPWTEPEKAPEWSVLGESYPSMGIACRRLAEIGGFRGSVDSLYGLLSASSHPNTIELFLITNAVEVDRRIEFPYFIDEDVLLRSVGMAAAVMYRGAWIVCSFLGLDGTALERWADQVGTVAPTLLGSPADGA